MLRLLALLLVLALAANGRAAAPAGQVRVDICEASLPPHDAWPTEDMAASETYTEEAFGLFELPQKYISTGVRGDRAFPTLVRATATVSLPPGKHRLLLRARGRTRLLLDGRAILETPFDQPRQYAVGNAGELPVEEQNTFLDLGPECRFAPPGNREVSGEFEFSGRPVVVRLETYIGELNTDKAARPFRPELGETVVAVALGGSNHWRLLAPGARQIAYTDAGWAAYEAERRASLDAMNAAARAARRDASAAYWNQRREAARAWLAHTPAVPVPELPKGVSAPNPIDRFVMARIAQASAEYAPIQKAGGVDFHRDIKPILEANCFSCHQGNKVKGGLRLDQRATALRGGENDGPAIVPGHPQDSALFQRITSQDSEEVMPAKGDRLPADEVALIKKWIEQGAVWPEFATTRFDVAPPASDLEFLRRVTLDTVGVVPSEAEIAAFLADRSSERRTRVIDRLLADSRWADHATPYWLDVLAENPNLINPTLNNTGPFRWWIYESLRDNKPLDLFATELVRMEGSERFGGPAGFGVASQNDVPMAAKGIIVSSAFLGIELKCARCHDAPTHSSKQKELFELAAMLAEKPLKVPTTSSVSLDHLRLGGRVPLIQVTLEPGSTVSPAWPFAAFADESASTLAEHPNDPRDRLAALITAPQNERFAQVMVNRLWEQFMGRGLVDPSGDWEKGTPTHPELLHWLGRELVRSGYDAKAIARLILTSAAYQRAADPQLAQPGPLYVSRAPRRISAEQLVDSMFAATGKPFVVEPVCLDVDGVRTIENALDLGCARRAWMLASTSNERDRPSLTLPRIQAVAEVMEVFGWRGARPDPAPGNRDVDPNLLQPALLSNGTMMTWLTRLSDDHGCTQLALEKQSVEHLLDRLYLRMFTRHPSAEEMKIYVAQLSPGYATRITPTAPLSPARHEHRKYVAWSNHMKSEANTLRLEEQAAARRGDPATNRLDPDWRQRFEDVIWALLNAPEWTRIL